MNSGVLEVSIVGIVVAFIPAAIVLLIMFVWRAGAGTAVYATARMLVQLLLIGYVLIYIFETDNFTIILAVLAFMLVVSSWIAIRPLGNKNSRTYLIALVSISIGGVSTLLLVTQAVIVVEPWFSPRYVVPLAGMIFSGSMTAISLAGDRFQSELARDVETDEARRIAFHTAMIPITNSLFAVGLVALPGMMTGQILSGVSPLIAAKYQIVVMTMLFGASGISAALFLTLQRAQKS